MRRFLTRRILAGVGFGLAVVFAVIGILLRPDDARAERILAECEAKTRAAMTLSADIEMTYTDSGWDFGAVRSGDWARVLRDSRDYNNSYIGTLKYERPHKGRLEVRRAGILRLAAVGLEWAVSDGKTAWQWAHYSPDVYRKTKDTGGVIAPSHGFGAANFFFLGRKIVKWNRTPVTVRDKGREIVDGVLCDVVEISGDSDGIFHPVYQLYIGQDKMLRRTVESPTPLPYGKKRRSYTCTLKNMVVNAPIPASAYAVTLPKGAKIR